MSFGDLDAYSSDELHKSASLSLRRRESTTVISPRIALKYRKMLIGNIPRLYAIPGEAQYRHAARAYTNSLLLTISHISNITMPSELSDKAPFVLGRNNVPHE